jgi:hypothetical protein
MRACKFVLSGAVALACYGSALFGNGFLDEIRLKAESGDREAQATLSYLYRSGKGVQKDRDEARKWSDLSYSKGNAAAQSRPTQRASPSEHRYSTLRSSPSRSDTRSIDSVRRMSPTRPAAGSNPGLRMDPSRPNGGKYASNIRVNPRGPDGRSVVSSSRVNPRRPATSFREVRKRRPERRLVERVSKANSLRSDYRRLESDYQSYRLTRKSGNKLLKGGRLLFSPISFTFRQSKKAVSKVARKIAFGAMVPL